MFSVHELRSTQFVPSQNVYREDTGEFPPIFTVATKTIFPLFPLLVCKYTYIQGNSFGQTSTNARSSPTRVIITPDCLGCREEKHTGRRSKPTGPAGRPQNSGPNQPNRFRINPSPDRPKLFPAPPATAVVTRVFFYVPENVCVPQNLLGLRLCPGSSNRNAVANQTFLLHIYTKHVRVRARLTEYIFGVFFSREKRR